MIAFDEFTSVVDRTVAKVGSAAVARGIRHNRFGERKQFVAVTCHYDVLDWLEPDWVLDMSSQQLARGRLRRRPPIGVTIAPIGRSAWGLFRRHHYLNTSLASGAKCFAAFWGDNVVAFSAWIHAMHRNRRPGDMREHRTVVLPDYQGIGIGNRVSEACASLWTALGGRATSTTSSPSMIHYRHASPLWRTSRFGMIHPPRGGMLEDKVRRGETRPFNSCKRVTGSFRYVGPPMPRDIAQRMADEYPHGAALRVLRSLGATTAQRVAGHMDYGASAVAQALDDLTNQGRVRRFRIGRNRWGYEAI